MSPTGPAAAADPTALPRLGLIPGLLFIHFGLPCPHCGSARRNLPAFFRPWAPHLWDLLDQAKKAKPHRTCSQLLIPVEFLQYWMSMWGIPQLWPYHSAAGPRAFMENRGGEWAKPDGPEKAFEGHGSFCLLFRPTT